MSATSTIEDYKNSVSLKLTSRTIFEDRVGGQDIEGAFIAIGRRGTEFISAIIPISLLRIHEQDYVDIGDVVRIIISKHDKCRERYVAQSILN